jgi:hypothetical protein
LKPTIPWTVPLSKLSLSVQLALLTAIRKLRQILHHHYYLLKPFFLQLTLLHNLPYPLLAMSIIYLAASILGLIKRYGALRAKVASLGKTMASTSSTRSSLRKHRGDALTVSFRILSLVLSISAASLSVLKISTPMMVGEHFAATFWYCLFGIAAGPYPVS